MTGFIGLTPLTAKAIQLADGTVYFDKVPQLIDASVNFDTARLSRTKYNLKLSLPKESGEPLKAVKISQRTRLDLIAFDLEKTRAFRGKKRKQDLPVQSVAKDAQGHIDVTFDPPLPPGSNVTIQLRARANPDTGGMYLFGVRAFPHGQKVHSQFLGFGRILIFDSGDSSL